MAKNILVKTPLTTDGNMPVIGADGKQVYSEAILGYAAKAILEKRNTQLAAPLKLIITDIEDEPVPPAPNATPKPETKKTVQNATA